LQGHRLAGWGGAIAGHEDRPPPGGWAGRVAGRAGAPDGLPQAGGGFGTAAGASAAPYGLPNAAKRRLAAACKIRATRSGLQIGQLYWSLRLEGGGGAPLVVGVVWVTISG